MKGKRSDKTRSLLHLSLVLVAGALILDLSLLSCPGCRGSRQGTGPSGPTGGEGAAGDEKVKVLVFTQPG